MVEVVFFYGYPRSSTSVMTTLFAKSYKSGIEIHKKTRFHQKAEAGQ